MKKLDSTPVHNSLTRVYFSTPYGTRSTYYIMRSSILPILYKLSLK